MLSLLKHVAKASWFTFSSGASFWLVASGLWSDNLNRYILNYLLICAAVVSVATYMIVQIQEPKKEA